MPDLDPELPEEEDFDDDGDLEETTGLVTGAEAKAGAATSGGGGGCFARLLVVIGLAAALAAAWKYGGFTGPQSDGDGEEVGQPTRSGPRNWRDPSMTTNAPPQRDEIMSSAWSTARSSPTAQGSAEPTRPPVPMPACVTHADLLDGFMVHTQATEVCWGADSPESGTLIYHGVTCGPNSKKVLWTHFYNPHPRPGLDANSQCSWQRDVDKTWDEQWLGIGCGQVPGDPAMPSRLCVSNPDLDKALGPLPGVWVNEQLREFVVASIGEGQLRIEFVWGGREVAGRLRPSGSVMQGELVDVLGRSSGAAKLSSPMEDGFTLALKRAGASGYSQPVQVSKAWTAQGLSAGCSQTQVVVGWQGTEGPFTVDDPRGLRFHVAGQESYSCPLIEASRVVPNGALGLTAVYVFQAERGPGNVPLMVTLHDTQDSSKTYRWCFNGRMTSSCDKVYENYDTGSRWLQQTVWFACFVEKHGYVPLQYRVSLGARSKEGDTTTLVKSVLFEAGSGSSEVTENVALWAVDGNADARKRLVESIKTLVETRSGSSCDVPREPLAYAVVVTDGEPLTCDSFQQAKLKVPCMQVAARPGEEGECKAGVPARRMFQDRVLHIVSLPADAWTGVFAATIDAFAKGIKDGQPKDERLANQTRSDLIFSRANHLRFLADRIFLPFGVKQVLHLDNDICAVVPVDELLRTPGRAAVVAARKVDKLGQPVSRRDVITLTPRFEQKVGTQHGLTYSFNAGIVLLRTERMCEMGLMKRLIEVQDYHNNVERLWSKGTNQPPFEVAAADSLQIVPWYWNCRLYPGDIEKLKKYGAQKGSPVAWINNCKVIHPSTSGAASVEERSCSVFSGLGRKTAELCPLKIFVYDLPWPFDDLKKPDPSQAPEWPTLVQMDQLRVQNMNVGAMGSSASVIFGDKDTKEAGVFYSFSDNNLGPMINYRLTNSKCITQNYAEADVFVIPLFLAEKTERQWKDKCVAFQAGNGPEKLADLLPHLNDLTAIRHVLFNNKNLADCSGWWAAPLHQSFEQVQRVTTRYCYNPPCPMLTSPDPKQPGGSIYTVPYPSLVHWTALNQRDAPWAQIRERPLLMALIASPKPGLPRYALALREKLEAACLRYGPNVCQYEKNLRAPSQQGGGTSTVGLGLGRRLLGRRGRGRLLSEKKAKKSKRSRSSGVYDTEQSPAVPAVPVAPPKRASPSMKVASLYAQADFCLQPQGATCERRGILDALLLGCIPVLFSSVRCPQDELWELHWGSWQKDTSVVLDLAQVVAGTIDVRDALSRISARQKDHMRAVIKMHAHQMQYQTDDPPPDQPDALATLFKAIKFGRPPPPPPLSTE